MQLTQMDLDSTSVLPSSEDSEFVCSAQDVITIKFVSGENEMASSPEFTPQFVHQHFGENETIFGYKGLDITLYYTDASMYIYTEIKFDTQIKKSEDVEADDIVEKLRAQLPSCQIDMMTTSRDKFRYYLERQKTFKPFGELLAKFTTNGKELQMWKMLGSSKDFDNYLARVQTLALWYIDAANYTDNDDPRWMHYFLYEATKSTEDGNYRYKLAGYCSIVNFYCYPEKIRPRIAQIMLLPPYRRVGNGPKFLDAIYNDIVPMPNVKDITVEDPADEFIHLRDFLDCRNCSKLIEFSPDKLREGYCDSMKSAALLKLKINPRQSRRVYEILRLMTINPLNTEEMKAYRLDVKQRLNRPFKKSAKDWRKLRNALDERQLAAVTAVETKDEQRMQLLQQMFEQAVADYKIVISRLKVYSSS
ncbi:hypothetical protein AB6A40_000701 [Gnathostoma spinigerum]|uniref:Histone acetyltransferase type B catalytic subunit n=1 Tax=Gnathostoma spinigerum TaxID=75299 RepID=A0ABD6E4P2_9BILA